MRQITKTLHLDGHNSQMYGFIQNDKNRRRLLLLIQLPPHKGDIRQVQ